MPRLIFIVYLFTLVSGCSRTELAYRNADWLLEYYAGETIDISDTQQEQWRPVLAQTLQQHRAYELPRLIAYLDLFRDVVNGRHYAEGAACLVDGAHVLSRRHARLAVDLAAPLLATIDRNQIEHLTGYMSERQEDLMERYLDPDPERREEARRSRFHERIEKWTGNMNTEQQHMVDEALGRMPDIAPYWLAYREQQTAGLLDLVHAGPDIATVRAYLDRWWVDWDGRSPDYRQTWHVARQEFIVLLERIGASLTEKQRARLIGRLASLREDLAGFIPSGAMQVSLPAVTTGCAASRLDGG